MSIRVKKPFTIIVSSIEIPSDNGVTKKYVISSNGLAEQILDNCSPEELTSFSKVTPLSCFTQVTGLSELELRVELARLVPDSNMSVDYYNEDAKSGTVIFFTDEVSAATLVKLISDKLDSHYKFKSVD